ncbi:uncharacterized protein PHACADRAFT_154240 [Phanerochaete carnosa HHB-10118-sp]|uniref:IgA peptidase M64-domain-containing protein n=1 Tax=Phanerochaete carnosa (strain HHB-10118-sp) TaxID=650164 RepID=K5VT03_PHACS|nr:uncharacterized protein PHACADRAFT_154240 [Phanerochaete carnosa HHB-10118-sp]EKM49714.1 hypothetical protein PHACADRAFT_154240 [Phanerochaete carnosa HHB-10118-sp]
MYLASAPLISLAFALSALAAPDLGRLKRPLELVVLQDCEGTCDILTLRDAQHVRGLPPRGVHTGRLPTQSGQERISFVSYDEHTLWRAAQSQCGTLDTAALIPDDTSQASQQSVLTSPQLKYSTNLVGKAPPMQVHRLIKSGDSSNRVDLVFFSDGYTDGEHAKFLEDAKRLAEDVSYNQTFNTVKPLLNFWAAFTPSKESGVGVGGKPKDTVFGLYRDGTELRGVLYSKPEVARAACLSLGDACDYPILMGNDPLSGGLGGEFTVITPSLANGPLVLRHELGHSIIDVGEEYDGGYAYFGVNAAANLSTVPWAHWLTPSPTTDAAPAAAHSERAAMPLQAYAWTLLNTSAPWTARFAAAGTYARHLVRFSLSGVPAAADLRVALDGADLAWEPRPGIGRDRWHYDVYRAGGLAQGAHEVEFALVNAAREGDAQMCSVEVLEFGDEHEFNATPGHYSMYPTFSLENTTTYRPTNEDCLMRQVTTADFCSACTEGLWTALLRRVDPIDALTARCTPGAAPGTVDLAAELRLVPLAAAHADSATTKEQEAAIEGEEAAIEGEAAAGASYTVAWTQDGAALPRFANATRLAVRGVRADAVFAVDVAFATDEVRVDRDGLLASHRDMALAELCAL